VVARARKHKTIDHGKIRVNDYKLRSSKKPHICSADLIRSGNEIFQINFVTQVHLGSTDLK
jgi:hypothetical protein